MWPWTSGASDSNLEYGKRVGNEAYHAVLQDLHRESRAYQESLEAYQRARTQQERAARERTIRARRARVHEATTAAGAMASSTAPMRQAGAQTQQAAGSTPGKLVRQSGTASVSRAVSAKVPDPGTPGGRSGAILGLIFLLLILIVFLIPVPTANGKRYTRWQLIGYTLSRRAAMV